MNKVDHLIHAKWMVTCADDNQVLEDHTLVIHDNKILAILPGTEATQRYQANDEQHYLSHAITPGFINSHTHIAMNLFRGLADDLELMDWLNNHIWPAESKWVSQELVYDGSLLAMAEMIRCGTICFNDMYFFLGATAQAAELAGMRAHIGMTIIDVPTAWAKTTEEYFTKAIEFYQQYKNNELITPTLAPHSTYTVSTENLEKVKKLADDYHLKINIHLQEAPSEIEYSIKKYHQRPLQRLHNIGMLSPNLIAIHMTQINDADFAILQETQPNIVHCPESNMKLVSGSCPVEKLAQMGINVALGTDGAASNNDLDMLGEMRSAALLGKITANDPKALPAMHALKMATINGAKALGIEHITGSLEPGKAADFIAIDLNHIETQPVYHPVSQIVYATPRSQVTDVWVAGKQLLKNRELTTLDEKELIKKAQTWRKKIKS
ncbi:MAG: TRZ/ATZ family hydrolase [Gammaproteobacteria bacterium]|nr:TRZ/ATZ family hydrolase [Gammaproteobacteria bacterium]MCW5582779.1 TRZ/ATZ family hydrolase [Gammaproteobacteria bacterium]